jgi:hypothetical protein
MDPPNHSYVSSCNGDRKAGNSNVPSCEVTSSLGHLAAAEAVVAPGLDIHMEREPHSLSVVSC